MTGFLFVFVMFFVWIGYLQTLSVVFVVFFQCVIDCSFADFECHVYASRDILTRFIKLFIKFKLSVYPYPNYPVSKNSTFGGYLVFNYPIGYFILQSGIP